MGVEYKNFIINSGLNYIWQSNISDYTIRTNFLDTVHYYDYTGGIWNKQLIVRYYEWDGIDTTWINIYDSTYIPLDSTLITRYDTSVNKTTKKVKNKFSIIEIPVIIGYRHKLNNFQISFKSGFITGLLVKSSGNIYQHDEFTTIQTIKQNKLLFSIVGSIGANYQIKEKIYGFMDLCLRKQINPIFQDNIYYKQMPVYYGLKCGIICTF